MDFVVVIFVFQTVKYFNNEGYEGEKYDEYLKSKLTILILSNPRKMPLDKF